MVKSSIKPKKSATFPLARLIRGCKWVPLCKVGGAGRLLIPSALAYSIRDRGYLIQPNRVLVFDIEVLSGNSVAQSCKPAAGRQWLSKDLLPSLTANCRTLPRTSGYGANT
jgi:hypothetical protein